MGNNFKEPFCDETKDEEKETLPFNANSYYEPVSNGTEPHDHHAVEENGHGVEEEKETIEEEDEVAVAPIAPPVAKDESASPRGDGDVARDFPETADKNVEAGNKEEAG